MDVDFISVDSNSDIVSPPSQCSVEDCGDVITILSDSEKQVSLPSEIGDSHDDMDLFCAEPLLKPTASREDFPKEVFAEIFSRPRVINMIAALHLTAVLSGSLSIDILTGFDLRLAAAREAVMKMLLERSIHIVVLSPPCTMFSQIMHINFAKMKPDDLRQRWKDAMCFIHFTIRIIRWIVSKNGFFVFEHPTGASSWRLPCIQELLGLPGVKLICFHQCRFGLKAPISGLPMRKSTRFLTNSQQIIDTFDGVYCNCTKPHRVIEGSEGKYRLSKWCEQYPPGLCEALAKSLAREVAR